MGSGHVESRTSAPCEAPGNVDERVLRTFVALELPESVKEAVRGARSRLRDELGEAERLLRWVDPGSVHLTLTFLGPMPESLVPEVEAAIQRAVVGISPFGLRTTAIGCFPSGRRPRVVWLGLDGDLERLGALQGALEEQVAPFGLPGAQAGTAGRPFAPHLTLARPRPDARPADRAVIGRAVGNIWPAPGVPFTVAEVSLMLSEPTGQGTVYTRLAVVPMSPLSGLGEGG